MKATQPPPLYIINEQGQQMRRVSPVSNGRWITKGTGVEFIRRHRVVKLPYATYRRGNDWRHIAADQIGPDGKLVKEDMTK